MHPRSDSTGRWFDASSPVLCSLAFPRKLLASISDPSLLSQYNTLFSSIRCASLQRLPVAFKTSSFLQGGVSPKQPLTLL